MTFKIDKGLPIPDAWPHFVRTLRKLEIGDSFQVDDPGLATAHTIYSLARREGIRVSVRQMDGGIRVWRVNEQQHMNTADVPRSRKNLNRAMHYVSGLRTSAP